MMKLKIICISVISCFLFSVELNAQTKKLKISKCKDEKGSWHYGSNNLHKCADSSKITTFNERGVKINQVDAVKTQEQLAAEEQSKEEQRKAIEKRNLEELEKRRILTVYMTEEDIENAREEKMRSFDIKIEQHKSYIEALTNLKNTLKVKSAKTTNGSLKRKYSEEVKTLPAKVEDSKKRITELVKEQIQSNGKFDQDLIIFRKYKS